MSRLRRSSRRKTQTILVPVDFTDSSLRALNHALFLAERLDAFIAILHVADAIYTGGWASIFLKHKNLQEMRLRALRTLHELAVAKRRRCVPISWLFRSGVIEYEILKCADQIGAGLIVFGRRSRNPLRRLIFGSVSDDVADFSHCPVLVVNDNASPPYPDCEPHPRNGAY